MSNEREQESLTPKEIQPPATDLGTLIRIITDRVDQIVQIIGTIADRSISAKQAESKFRIHMSWIATLVVLMIVAIAGLLTYLDKIDGSTFTFLLGLVVGYVLSFIRDSITPPKE